MKGFRYDARVIEHYSLELIMQVAVIHLNCNCSYSKVYMYFISLLTAALMVCRLPICPFVGCCKVLLYLCDLPPTSLTQSFRMGSQSQPLFPLAQNRAMEGGAYRPPSSSAPGTSFRPAPETMAAPRLGMCNDPCPICGRNGFATVAELETHSAKCTDFKE